MKYTTVPVSTVNDDVEGYFLLMVEKAGRSLLGVKPCTIKPQYVSAPDIVDDEELFVIDNSQGFDFNVNCNREIRKGMSAGDILFAKDLKVVSSSKGKLLLYSENVERVAGDKELEDLFKEYTSGKLYSKTKKSTPKVETIQEEPTPSSKVISKSPLSRLLTNFPIPTIEDDGWYVEKEVWSKFLLNTLELSENTLLVGPSGTGKTELIMFYANRIGMDCEVIDMAGMQDPVAAFQGTHRIGVKGSYFDEAKFIKNIQKKMLMVLDEANRAPVSSTNNLFSALDSRRHMNLPNTMNGDDSIIKVNDGLRFFATANEGINYTGAGIMDQAFRDRFPSVVELNYLPIHIEIELLMKKTNIDRKQAEQICSIAGDIRTLHVDEELSKAVSARHTQMAAKYMACGMDATDALLGTILTAFNTTEEKQVVQNIIQGR